MSVIIIGIVVLILKALGIITLSWAWTLVIAAPLIACSVVLLVMGSAGVGGATFTGLAARRRRNEARRWERIADGLEDADNGGAAGGAAGGNQS